MANWAALRQTLLLFGRPQLFVRKLLGAHGANGLCRGNAGPQQESQTNSRRGPYTSFVPADELLYAISRGGGAGFDLFVVQVTLDIRAKSWAVAYRRVRSFSRAFITIQSSSPRSARLNWAVPARRGAETVVAASATVVIRVLGWGGSCSRMMRRSRRSRPPETASGQTAAYR